MFDDGTTLAAIPEGFDEELALAISTVPTSDDDYQRLEDLSGESADDWRAYFAFSKAHGGRPVECEGRSIFEDGWGWSATRVSGPGYRPPQAPGEVLRLKLAYWEIRRRQTVDLANRLRAVLADPRADLTPELFAPVRDALKSCEDEIDLCSGKLAELENDDCVSPPPPIS